MITTFDRTRLFRSFGRPALFVIFGFSFSGEMIGSVLPEHDGRSTVVPATIVGSGPHNLRIWTEPGRQNEVNVQLGGLRAYEYVAHVTMIDLLGNTIVDRSMDTPKGYLDLQLTSETPLPKGIYLLTIRTSDRTWTDRVVVEY